MTYDSEFILYEEGIDPLAVVSASILFKHLGVAGRPLLIMEDIPVLPDVGVVEEGHDACVVLAASVDVPHSCRVLGLVALVIDVVHG